LPLGKCSLYIRSLIAKRLSKIQYRLSKFKKLDGIPSTQERVVYHYVDIEEESNTEDSPISKEKEVAKGGSISISDFFHFLIFKTARC